MAGGRSEETSGRSRSITELQRDAPGIVREATENGQVEIRRYGETVAYVVSPDERRRLAALDDAAERAIWAVDFERAMKDAAEGRIVDLEEAIVRLRAIARGE